MATLPQGVGLDTSINYVTMPTNTYIIDWTSKQIVGMGEGIEALRQAVEIYLRTERFRWQIYSSNHGSELEDLIGEEYDYITSEIPRRVNDAFSVDSRILSTENYVFKDHGDGTMGCSFEVKTVYGVIHETIKIG